MVTGPVVGASLDGATLTGSVNPLGLSATYRFEFGLTSSYGLQTAVGSLAPVRAPVPISFVLAGLQAHRVYH